MYRVWIEEREDQEILKRIDAIMVSNSLYNLLGRCQVKYGIAQKQWSSKGCFEVEFYLPQDKGHYIACLISWCKISKDDFKKSGKEVTVVPPPPPAVVDKRIAAMQDAGLLAKGN